MPMLRTFDLRLKGQAAERSELERILADSVETYNAALQERSQRTVATLARLPHCGRSLNRDHNPGPNILGLGMSAAGSPSPQSL
jgi:hypothetical protein